MNILISIISIILGLILLTFGGNVLVDGAVSIAKKFGISEAIIGLTIVAIGTSMPELIVSILASIGGNSGIAIGNVLGSNIANIFFILGFSACIAPITLSRTTRFFDLPILILITVLFLVLVSDVFLDGAPSNMISRIDGIVLITIATFYILYSIRHNNFIPDESEVVEKIISPSKASLWIFAGIAVLFIGGKILVDGAVDIAKLFGLSEAIIGLTIVAIGTSMPELATSIIAAKRGNPDIAVGNVIGSNVMNILVILGISSFIAPLPFASASYIDLFVGLSGPIILILLTFLWKRNSIGRKEGSILVTLYFLYLAYLIYIELL